MYRTTPVTAIRSGTAVWVAAAVAAALSGCGNSSGGTPKVTPKEDASADGGGDASAVPADAAVDSGVVAKEAGAQPEAGPSYYVEVTALYLGPALQSVYATVGTGDRPTPGAACSGTQSGACCYVAGAAISTGTPPDAGAGPSAGDITVANTTGDSLVLMPPYAGGSLAWTPGDVLQVTAAGADIAAFSGAIHTPGAIGGVTPSFDTLATLASSGALTVSWTPGGGSDAEVVLALTGTGSEGTVGTVTCAVKDSAGQVVVDASIIGHFAPGNDATLSLLRTTTAAGSIANGKTYLTGGWQVGAIAAFQ
jgi:hypothetical protein